MVDPSRAPAGPGLTRFARRGSARLAYQTEGPTAGAEVVALLHDLLGDRSGLSGLRDALVAREPSPFRVLLPDARGHGASAALAGRRLALDDLADDLLAVLDAEGFARAHIIGHGLGGAIAFVLARRAPGRVRSLVLVEPALSGVLAADPDPTVRAVLADSREVTGRASDAADKGLTDRALDALLVGRWGNGWRDWLSRPRLAAVRRHAGSLAPLLSALDAYDPTADDVRGVAVPTLVLHRAGAAPLDRLVAERLGAWLPAARLATVPDPAHAAEPLAGPAGAALADAVRAFLARQPGDDAEEAASDAQGPASGGPDASTP